MAELKDNGKINFIVNQHHGFNEILTGGNIAMHYLSYLLAKRGHNVYMFTTPEYPHENIITLKSKVKGPKGIVSSHKIEDFGVLSYSWERLFYNVNNTVSIYNQTTWGNWFNTKHVARWLLYNVSEEIEATWGENDTYFSYGNQSNLIKSSTNKPTQELIAMDFHLDTFKNENRKNRKGFCHFTWKHDGPNSLEFLKELNSTELRDWDEKGRYHYLNEMFNQHEYFITYDQLSFWPQAAALCGCKVIVMNSPNNPNSYYPYSTTPEQYRKENPLKKYGVAFGFEDLQWALDTQHLVRSHLEKIDKQNEETVDNFVKFWENKCYG